MITKITAFRATDGQTFETIEEVKLHELSTLMDATPISDIPKFLVKHAEKVMDILTTKSNSKTAARKINGGTKVYKPRSEKSKARAAAKAAAEAAKQMSAETKTPTSNENTQP